MAFNPSEHLMNLKGKDYLEVKWRLVWFREDHPDWCIETMLVDKTEDSAIFRAMIVDENGLQKSSGHGSETRRDFGDFLEKAETKAVGRALAMLGYGTQFAPELEEGDRIVDAPVERKPHKTTPKPVEVEQPRLMDVVLCDRCGKPIVNYSDKNGRTITATRHADGSRDKFGKVLCLDCITEMLDGKGDEAE